MKLSKFASLIVAGGIVAGITGCGLWNDDNNAVPSAVNASDAYVIAFGKDGNESGLVNVECADANKTVLATVAGPKGYLEFNESVVGCKVIIPDTAWVDADLDGEFNASKDALISMPLKTVVGKARYANPLTTYAVEKGDDKLLQVAANFDPVEAYAKAATDENTKKLLQVAETIKTVAKLGGNVADLNITEDVLTDENVTTDTILGALANDNTIKTAVDAKVNAVVALVETLANSGLSAEEIQKVAVQVSDLDKPVADVIKDLDVNVSDEVTNQLTSIDANITAVNEALPAKLAVPNYIQVGNEIATLVNGSFNYTLTTTDDSKVEDYYNIKIPILAITQKDVTEANPIKVAITATIKDSQGREVSLYISDVEVYQDANGETVVKIPANTEIGLSTNIASLKTAIGGDSVNTYVASDLTNTDFDVNVQTLINNVTANQDKIDSALAKFTDYLKVTNSYTVTVDIENKSTVEWFMTLPEKDGKYEITGTVNVVNTSITPPQPGEITSSEASSEASSVCSVINPITGACEDTTSSEASSESSSEASSESSSVCSVVNPITGLCED